jgi:hypothetical protein
MQPRKLVKAAVALYSGASPGLRFQSLWRLRRDRKSVV